MVLLRLQMALLLLRYNLGKRFSGPFWPWDRWYELRFHLPDYIPDPKRRLKYLLQRLVRPRYQFVPFSILDELQTIALRYPELREGAVIGLAQEFVRTHCSDGWLCELGPKAAAAEPLIQEVLKDTSASSMTIRYAKNIIAAIHAIPSEREAKPEMTAPLKKYSDVGLQSDEVPEKYRDLASKVTAWYISKGREVAEGLNWEVVVRDLDGWFGPGVPRHLIAEAEQLLGGPKASPKAKFTMRIGSVLDTEFGVLVAGSPEGVPPHVGDTIELVRASGTTQVQLKDWTSMGSRWALVLEGVKHGDIEIGDILQS